MTITVRYLLNGVVHSHKFSFRYVDYNRAKCLEVVQEWKEKNLPEEVTESELLVE
jgi:5,10-methylene-tetrahydrofolate dehydrogenase/methenyl tetrahydrofolate cyclohydrolase